MSHEKTKRIESPIKGKFYSMIRHDNKPDNFSMFNSRHTIRRKPIFNDTVERSHLSSVSPSRRKIFTDHEKSFTNSQEIHFAKIIQNDPLERKFDAEEHKKPPENLEIDSISSSSIESNEGLEEVKRRLFPTTPIKKIIHDPEDLEDGRDFLTNSWKKLQFLESDDPLQETLSISSSQFEKTVLKSNLNTPLKSETEPLTNNKESSYKVCLNFDQPLKEEDSSNKKFFFSEQPKKDLAAELREIHEQLTVRSRTSIKINDVNACLRRENEFLRKENERLQQKFLELQMKTKP